MRGASPTARPRPAVLSRTWTPVNLHGAEGELEDRASVLLAVLKRAGALLGGAPLRAQADSRAQPPNRGCEACSRAAWWARCGMWWKVGGGGGGRTKAEARWACGGGGYAKRRCGRGASREGGGCVPCGARWRQEGGECGRRIRIERGGAAQALEQTQHGGVRRVCVDEVQFGAVGTLLLDAAQEACRRAV